MKDMVSNSSHLTQQFEDAFTEFLRYIKRDSHFEWSAASDLAAGVEIPSSLLLGPSWTDEMIRYLFWLVKSGARVEWFTSISGEVKLSLITHKNTQADTDSRWLFQGSEMLYLLEIIGRFVYCSGRGSWRELI
jgi:hypothetical protein